MPRGRDPHYAPEGRRGGDLGYGFTDLERDWSDLPWLNQVDKDFPFQKTFLVDLDPSGGADDTVTISLGGVDRLYTIVEEVDLVPMDDPSMQDTLIETMLDGVPFYRTRRIDQTADYENDLEKETLVDRFFRIPPGRTWHLRLTNTSIHHRSRYTGTLRGFVSRIVN